MDLKAIELRNVERRSRSAASAISYDVSEKMTRESEAAECDVNLIMKRATQGGLQWPPDLSGVEKKYLDCVAIGGFEEAQATYVAGNEIFEKLSAEARAEFKNDPATFFAFASNPDNEEVLVEKLVGKKTADEWRIAYRKAKPSDPSPDKAAALGAGGSAAPAAVVGGTPPPAQKAV